MYLNVKCILTFLIVLTPKISLIHKITIFVIYTPWETLENFWFTLPHLPLYIYIYCIYYNILHLHL